MSASVATQDGRIRKLDKPTEASEVITAADVQDAEKLARLMQELKSQVADLAGRWNPRVIDFERVPTTGTGGAPVALRLAHSLNGRVRYWVTGWESPSAFSLNFIENTAQTDANTLVLTMYCTGTISVRIEEAG